MFSAQNNEHNDNNVSFDLFTAAQLQIDVDDGCFIREAEDRPNRFLQIGFNPLLFFAFDRCEENNKNAFIIDDAVKALIRQNCIEKMNFREKHGTCLFH